MRFRRIYAIAGVAAFAVTMAGCASGGGEAGTPEKLTIMITNSPSANALQAVAPGFTEETGIEIEFVDVPYDQLGTKLVLAGQSRTATFDIAQFDQPVLASVVPSGGLLALDEYVDGDAAYDIGDFPQALQEYSKYEGTTYGIPLSTEPYVQIYRTDLYEQAGVTPAQTWEEVNANSKAVTALGPDVYGYAGPYGPTGSAEAYAERLYQYGGRILDPETFEPLLDSAVAEQALIDFVDLVPDSPEATLSGTSIDSAIQFSQLEVGLDLAPSGWFGGLDNPEQSAAAGKIAVAPVPSEEIGDFAPANILKGWLIGVSGQSQYPDAAWDFLSYALSPDNVQMFIDEGSPVVGRTSTIENPDYQEQLPYLPLLTPGIETGEALPTIPELVPIITAISQGINLVATQGADPGSTLDRVNDEVRKILVDSGRLGK